MTVTVIYRFEAAEGKADALLAMLQQGRDFALTVDGCEGYEVFQGERAPRTLLMVERWTSAEAHREHFEKNVKASGVLDQAVALMAAPPDLDDAYFVLR